MASLSKSFIAVGGLLSTVNAQTSYSPSSIQSMSPTAVRQASSSSSPTTAGSTAQGSMIPSSASPTLNNNYPTPLPTSLGSQPSTSISPSSSGSTILSSSSSTEINVGPTQFPTSIGSQQSQSSSGPTSPSQNPSTAGTSSVTVLTDTDSPTADVASSPSPNPSTAGTSSVTVLTDTDSSTADVASSPSPNPSTAGTASVTVLTDTASPTADVASSPSPNPSTAGTASVTVLTDTDSPTAVVVSVTNDNVPTPIPMVESTSIPTTYYYEPTALPSLPTTEDLPSVPTSTSRVEPAPPAPPPRDEPPTTDHHDYSNYMDLSALHQKEPIEGNPLYQADIHYKSSQENVFEVITTQEEETYMPTQDPTIPSSIVETTQEEDGPVTNISTEDDDDEIMRMMSPHFVDEGHIQAHYNPGVMKKEDDEPSNKDNNKFANEEDGEEETTNVWVGSVNLWTEKEAEEVEEEVIKTETRRIAPHTIVKKHDGNNPQQQPREVAKDAEEANTLWVGTVNLWKDKDAQITIKKEDSYNDFAEKANKDPYSDSTEEVFKVDSSNLWKEGYESSHFAGGRLRVMNSSSRVVVGASVAIIALASVGIGWVML